MKTSDLERLAKVDAVRIFGWKNEMIKIYGRLADGTLYRAIHDVSNGNLIEEEMLEPKAIDRLWAKRDDTSNMALKALISIAQVFAPWYDLAQTVFAGKEFASECELREYFRGRRDVEYINLHGNETTSEMHQRIQKEARKFLSI